MTDMRQASLDIDYFTDSILPIDMLDDSASVDVNIRTDDVYWTNGLHSVIYKSSLSGGPPVPVVRVGLVSPRSIAVDWIAGNRYWLYSGTKRIEV